jgi:hypothetical protein
LVDGVIVDRVAVSVAVRADNRRRACLTNIRLADDRSAIN